MAKLQPYDSAAEHRTLTDQEIEAFFQDIDTDNDGIITVAELERKLEEVHLELAPSPQPHHLHHPRRRSGIDNATAEKGHIDSEHDGLMQFLTSLLPGCEMQLDKTHFIDHVRSWNIPSQDQTSIEDEDAADIEAESSLPLTRRLRARWSVEGPKVVFILCVAALTIGLSVWQGVKYINSPDLRAALGWGIILAKFCAGALYSIMFFLLLSMSRIFATFMRRFYYVSRFVNWDRSQSFHMWMASIALFLATLHAIGHLTGTFLTGSQPDRQPAVAVIYGSNAVPRTYASFVASLPGWTGVTSLALIWVISVLSIQQVRNWSYELFQLGHLLMFPLMGLLSAHGVAQILGQYPMLGFWLVFPSVLVIIERCQRIIRGFIKVPTMLEVLDDDTIALTCTHPRGKPWRYAAGQYIFLQVPSISFFQWHPFTISACKGKQLQLHIKTDGNWTARLRDLEGSIHVGIDGPYGAPAQRFYDFDKSIIIGSGIGITPFSAIVTDLEQDLSRARDPWTKSRRGSRSVSRPGSRASSARPTMDRRRHLADLDSSDATESPISATHQQANIDGRTVKRHSSDRTITATNRRIDFHWMVREKNYLLWFSTLLNRAHDLSRAPDLPTPLELNINTHITAKRKKISTHVFRYLLDSYRTASAPYSALTGLKARSHFGRPDFNKILADFHEDMLRSGVKDEKVGVFFCGAPVIGSILSDACAELTAKSRADGHKIRYIFMMEVFG